MNRDERRTRARGTPPERVLVRETPALMPIDPEGGGTWISVNRLGMTLALLNRYEESPRDPPGTVISRGRLIREMAWAGTPEAVESELHLRPLDRYRPFTLASLMAGGVPSIFDWDGRRLAGSQVTEPGLVRASSGSDQVEAERVRGALFRRAATEPDGLTATVLERLHRSHLPEKGPLSICMHREEATTVSLSLVTVTGNEVSMLYVDGPPGETPGGFRQSL